jgi:hypothetical protein
VTLTTPDTVAFALGAVIDTDGGVISPAVVKVISPLVAVLLLASTDVTR